MNQQILAYLADVRQGDISNYDAGRLRYVSEDKRARIDEVRQLSKAQLVLRFLQSGKTLTPQESLRYFGLHALSQTITRLKRQGHPIKNIGSKGPHDYAIYQLQENEK